MDVEKTHEAVLYDSQLSTYSLQIGVSESDVRVVLKQACREQMGHAIISISY